MFEIKDFFKKIEKKGTRADEMNLLYVEDIIRFGVLMFADINISCK